MTDSSGMNRRDFLGRSAAALAGTMVVPGSAVSYEESSERTIALRSDILATEAVAMTWI